MNPLFIGIRSLSVRYGCLYLRRSLDLINHRLLNQCNICFNCMSILLRQILVSTLFVTINFSLLHAYRMNYSTWSSVKKYFQNWKLSSWLVPETNITCWNVILTCCIYVHLIYNCILNATVLRNDHLWSLRRSGA